MMNCPKCGSQLNDNRVCSNVLCDYKWVNCFSDDYVLRNSLSDLREFLVESGIKAQLEDLDERFVDMVKEDYGTFEAEWNTNAEWYELFKDSLDEGMIEYCDVFNANDCGTVMCCNGHGKMNPWILFKTTVSVEQIETVIRNNWPKMRYIISEWINDYGVRTKRLEVIGSI